VHLKICRADISGLPYDAFQNSFQRLQHPQRLRDRCGPMKPASMLFHRLDMLLAHRHVSVMVATFVMAQTFAEDAIL
jgi:hypothetical protein